MLPELAVVLKEWRLETHYARDSDWVFASPFTSGRRPYWAESALQNHIKPAVIKAGVTKHVSWHVFRHSFASMLGQAGHDVKVVQELLRHANSRITADVYQQANQDAKRSALTHVSGLFVVPEKRLPGDGALSQTCLDEDEIQPFANCVFCVLMLLARLDLSPLESGGDDGARTRDLCRDRGIRIADSES